MIIYIKNQQYVNKKLTIEIHKLSNNQFEDVPALTFDFIMNIIDEHSVLAITDKNGVITHANDEFVRLSKYSRGELLGNDHNIIKSDEHSDEFFTELWRTITTGNIWKGEIKNKAKDNSFYWLKTTIKPMFDTKNNIVGYVSLRTNITEQKNQSLKAIDDKLQIEKQNERLEELDELLEIKNLKLEAKLLENQKKLIKTERLVSIGMLASRMSHDLRNPLSVIRITLENIKIEYSNVGVEKEKFDKIDRSINRIVHQIEDVLDFVKIHKPDMYKIKFYDLISESIDSCVIPKDIKLIIKNNDVEFLADKKLLSVAINNLIYNSVQAIKNKGVIEINCEQNNDEVIIQIKDSGKGIPDEHVGKIFDPLYTTKMTGTGLGLASVKSIVESHGGTISVTSSPTVFTIRLPK